MTYNAFKKSAAFGAVMMICPALLLAVALACALWDLTMKIWEKHN